MASASRRKSGPLVLGEAATFLIGQPVKSLSKLAGLANGEDESELPFTDTYHFFWGSTESTDVGSIIGALVVILGGKDENMGFFHGIGVGALSGAILAMEILDSFLAFLNSHPSQSRGTLLLVIKFSCGYVSRKIVQERVTQAIYATLPRQVNDLEESRDIFDTETPSNGLSLLALQGLGRANFDVTQKTGTSPTCAICLQDFQHGEDIRKLPLCSHIFHLPCVDAWLAKHGTCPLCRRHFDH